MLPKWKQRKYILVLLFWVLSLYDVNEREVWSMALNDNIKKFREEKNLTQQQLADKLYVSRQTVCRWENGSRCPDLITAKKLALELDVLYIMRKCCKSWKRMAEAFISLWNMEI